MVKTAKVPKKTSIWYHFAEDLQNGQFRCKLNHGGSRCSKLFKPKSSDRLAAAVREHLKHLHKLNTDEIKQKSSYGSIDLTAPIVRTVSHFHLPLLINFFLSSLTLCYHQNPDQPIIICWNEFSSDRRAKRRNSKWRIIRRIRKKNKANFRWYLHLIKYRSNFWKCFQDMYVTILFLLLSTFANAYC